MALRPDFKTLSGLVVWRPKVPKPGNPPFMVAFSEPLPDHKSRPMYWAPHGVILSNIHNHKLPGNWCHAADTIQYAYPKEYIL